MIIRRVTATEAVRHFSELLDAVESRGETFIVLRRGRAVARIGATPVANGRTVKEILRRHRPDRAWATEVRALRSAVSVEDRR